MEGDDDKLEDSNCLPRLLEDVQIVHIVLSYFARMLTRRGVYSRAAFISLNCAAFI